MTRAAITLGDSYLSLFDPAIGSKFILIESPRGCGKTRAILSAIMVRALQYPGSRWILARSSRVRLSQSVLTTLEEQVFPAFGLRVPGTAGAVNRTSYDLPNGSKLIPMGLDDQARTQSVECAGIYVAEATELANKNDVLALAGAMRQDVPGLVHQCIVDCNPGAPGHWLNKAAEPIPAGMRSVNSVEDYHQLLLYNRSPATPGYWKRVVTKIQDNPAYFDVNAWKLTELGQSYLETLGYLSGFLKRRWIDGDWTMAEGSVYPEFTDRHIIEGFDIPREWPCLWATDPGYDHPCPTLVCAIAPNGRLYLCAEHVVRQTDIPTLAGQLTTRLSSAFNVRRKLGDPHYAFSKTILGNGKTFAEQMREFGHVYEPAPAARNNAEMAQQVEMVRTKLTTLGADGEPMLQVFRSCQQTINGFQSWGYQRNTKGETPGGEDKYEDVADDEMDCVRMIVASGPTFETTQSKVYRR